MHFDAALFRDQLEDVLNPRPDFALAGMQKKPHEPVAKPRIVTSLASKLHTS
jgi:hypothetical protein